MIKHVEVFARAAANYDFAGLWRVEDEVKRDLRMAEIELENAELLYKYASRPMLSTAYVNRYYAKVRYLEKLNAYYDWLS